MRRFDRGGYVLKTGWIGEVNVIRQSVLAPGERVSPSVRGHVKLSPLRERESAKIHARIDAFATPIRWLDSNWTAIIKEGPETTKAPATHDFAVPKDRTRNTMSDFGIGGNEAGKVLKYFVEAPKRVFNEWYKWPEDADITAYNRAARQAQNLPHCWSRLYNNESTIKPGADDYTLTTTQASSREKFTLQDISKLQARFRWAVEQGYFSNQRYRDLLQEVWGGNPTREVDQVPFRLRGAEVGVSPFELPAQDGASLGQTTSIYNFDVDHNFGRFVAPEHMVMTYMLVVRFPHRPGRVQPARRRRRPRLGLLDRPWRNDGRTAP